MPRCLATFSPRAVYPPLFLPSVFPRFGKGDRDNHLNFCPELSPQGSNPAPPFSHIVTNRMKYFYQHPSVRCIPLILFLLSSCSSVDLTTIVDTQFLLTGRELPFERVLLVFDSGDLALKQKVEYSFGKYIKEHTDAEVFYDIDMYSPLKIMSEKEKEWALRDNQIQGVLFLAGRGSGRTLRDWLLPEAKDIETETQAWRTSVIHLFLPATGDVVWAGSVQGVEGVITEPLLKKSFYGAVTGDLLRRGILEQPAAVNPGLRGFNR